MEHRRSVRDLAMLGVALTLAGGFAFAFPSTAHAAAPSTVTQTFGYTGSTTTFTVPAGITQLTVTANGGEGGRGGTDAAGASPLGGYRGVVTGTISVTPGQVLTIAVGSGGQSGNGGAGVNNATNYAVTGVALGGSNPLGGYAGGNGGAAGWQGSSGFGGAGGAATVISTSGTTIVAGGGGGAGGSGQYAPLVGRLGPATYTARPDTTSTSGQIGISVYIACQAPGSTSCDGGGGGAGGGGVQGGIHGDVQFGSGSYNEWYGYGGSAGQNSTGTINGLAASYQFYADDSANGSVTVSYTTGAPSAPTAVIGDARDSAVALNWTAPANVGGASVTDYVVEYATAADQAHWTTFNDGTSANTQALVTGLTNNTAYVFRVTAVNSFGNGLVSSNSDPVTPVGPPAAPVISSVTPGDGTLTLGFTPAVSGSPVTDYEYKLGNGNWISADTTTSPLTISGLTNGTTYSVMIRAVSAIGVGADSAPVSGTPAAPPGAPSITSIDTGPGTATVNFIPGYVGGSPIVDYDYQLNNGTWVSAGTTASPVTITGLSNGTTYSIALRAVTNSGVSAASPASTVTTPGAPAAPTVTSVIPGDRSLTIAFGPGNTGGSPITGYEYQLTSGGAWTAVPAGSSPFVVSGLTNGTAYAVKVRAANIIGTGTASSAVTGTPATVPTAPTIVGNTVAGFDAQLSAAFTAPASDGGSPILTYEYSTDAGATWLSRATGTTASPLVISALSSDGITPLTNGTTYSVEIRAVNAMGSGLASAVAIGVAKTTPSAPVITGMTAASSALTVTFQPGSNGGDQVTSYQYRLGNGTWTDTGSLGNSFVVTGLTNGTTYSVTVRAVNGQGAGSASGAVDGTPITTPGQPTITNILRGDRTLTVSASPSSTGGAPITSWQYSTDGGTTWATATQTSSPFTITRLSSNSATLIANGTSYPVVVRAVNAAGAGAASAVTNVGPAATPSAPVVTLTAHNQSVEVAYTLPSDGGSPVSAVQYRLNNGNWIDAGTLSSPFSIGGLTNGTAYVVEVRAVNAVGNGSISTPSSATPYTSPDAPNLVTAVSNTASADVSWLVPDTNGGAAITGYTATAYATSTSTTPLFSCTTTGLACSITGLTNGTTYYVSVTATNAAGVGTPSAPRTQVIPLARPGAPTLNSLTAGNSLLTLAFTAGSAGSLPITGYQYQLGGGAWVSTGSTTSPLTISGLTNGTVYTVALRAVSAAGVGASSTTLTGTPYTYPDAPSSITANGTNGSIVVTWAAPNNNGSAITGYTATAFNALTAGSQIATCSTSGALTCTITGLTNGTTYYVSLQATNGAGLSVRSAPRVQVTPSLTPGVVSGLAGTSGNGSVALSWTPGSTGASAISDYTIWYSTDSTNFTQFADGTSTNASATVTGLTNGTPYWFKVYAVNANGTGPASAIAGPVTPLAPGVVPTATTPVSTASGFTFDIANYAATGTTYTLTATNGATVSRNGQTVTVTGLAAGASSTVTITAAAAGATTTSLGVTGSALNAGIAPTFTVPTRAIDGYSFEITNYLPSANYTVSATGGAQVDRYGASIVVSGLAAGASSNITVSVSRTGYTDASAIEAGAALNAGATPTFSGLTPTVNGFTFTIANYLPGLVYTFGATHGAVVTRVGANVIVSGLAAGDTSAVTVTATDPGQSTASGTETGSALLAGLVPTFTTPMMLDGGFFFEISNYSPDFTYTATATNGATVQIQPDGTVLVGRLDRGDSSTVTITTTRTGYADASADATGASLADGVAPTFSTPVSTVDGFTFDITNDTGNETYLATVTGGATVTVVGTHVVVNDLTPGANATVTITSSRNGHTDASADVAGSASPVMIPPVDPTPTTPAATDSPTPEATPTKTASGKDTQSSATPTADDSSTAADAATDPGALPDQQPGDGAVTLNGAAVPSDLTTTDTRAVLTSGGLTMQMSAMVGGRENPLGPDRVVHVDRDGRIHLWLSGFRAGTTATVWVKSDLVEATKLTIGTDSNGEAEFVLPASIRSGEHTLVATGTTSEGRQASMSVGIVVDDATVATTNSNASSNTGWIWFLVSGGLLVVAGSIFLAAWRRRRDDDEPEAAISV